MPSDGVVREGGLGLISLVHLPKLEGTQENGWLELDAELSGELGIVLTPQNLQIIFIDHQPQMAIGVQSIDRQIHDPNGVSFYALNGVQTMHLTQVSDATAALVPASPPYGGGRRRRAVRRPPVSVLNLKLIKSAGGGQHCLCFWLRSWHCELVEDEAVSRRTYYENRADRAGRFSQTQQSAR